MGILDDLTWAWGVKPRMKFNSIQLVAKTELTHAMVFRNYYATGPLTAIVSLDWSFLLNSFSGKRTYSVAIPENHGSAQ